MSDVDVYVRAEYDANGRFVGTVPLLGVDKVIPLLKSWGLRVSGEGYAERDSFFAEFMYPESGNVRFEVTFEVPG